MELQIKILAVFHIIFGVFGVMGSLVVALLFGGAAGLDDPNAFLAVPVLGLVGGILVVSIFALSLPGIIAGIGLLRHRPWARILTIVLSVLDLIVIPIGTLLGIHGLWVLLSRNTAPLFGVTPAVTPAVPTTTPDDSMTL